MSKRLFDDCVLSLEVSDWTPSKRFALVRIWTFQVSLLLANLVDKSMVQLVDEIFPVIDCWRLCASMAATILRTTNAPRSGPDMQRGSSKVRAMCSIVGGTG